MYKSQASLPRAPKGKLGPPWECGNTDCNPIGHTKRQLSTERMQGFLQEEMTPMTENHIQSHSPDDFEADPDERDNEQSNETQAERRPGARGTAAMDQATRKEVARKGGLAVSKNREHMAEIGRKGGQAVSKNREHMARIGRKGGAAFRGSIKSGSGSHGGMSSEGGSESGESGSEL